MEFHWILRSWGWWNSMEFNGIPWKSWRNLMVFGFDRVNITGVHFKYVLHHQLLIVDSDVLNGCPKQCTCWGQCVKCSQTFTGSPQLLS
jgi:hypothetical protein